MPCFCDPVRFLENVYQSSYDETNWEGRLYVSKIDAGWAFADWSLGACLAAGVRILANIHSGFELMLIQILATLYFITGILCKSLDA